MKAQKRKTTALVLAAMLLFSWASSNAAPAGKEHPGEAASDPALDAVLARFDEVQKSLRSLRADFTQTTVNPLLKEPMKAKGRFYLSKPDSVLWEYAAPEAMQFAIARGEYTGYFPGRKKAERRDVHRWTEQIFRFFAVGQATTELHKFYDIRLGDAGPDMKGTVLLILDPTKRRVRKRVEEVRFWVDSVTYLPAKVAYVNKEGAARTIVFHNVELNPDLSASLFNVSIPSDVTVTNGFTEFGSTAPR
jgi:outer membrane lipoprotein-sorting protein